MTEVELHGFKNLHELSSRDVVSSEAHVGIVEAGCD